MPAYQNFITTYEGLEKVIFSSKDYQALYKLITQYSKIVTDLSDEKLQELMDKPDSALNILLLENPQCSPPIQADSLFQEIYADHSRVVDFPRDIFLLKLDNASCQSISLDYGICVIPESNIAFPKFYNTKFKWYIEKDDVLNKNNKVGWRCVLDNINISPLNSMVIIDNYLFENSTNNNGVFNFWGIDNIINLADALLPSQLNLDFHLLIVTKYSNKTIQWIESKLQEIETGIKPLRNYEIKVGIIIHNKSEKYHQRCIVTNYHFIDSQWGFAVFRNDVAWKNNHLTISGNYLTIDEKCDVDAKAATINLKTIKDLINSNNQKEYETNLNRGFVNNRMI